MNLMTVFVAKGKGSGGMKTAKLYAWVALQTLPEEMVISPCLLDFLEKALETIPITPVDRNYAGSLLVIFMDILVTPPSVKTFCCVSSSAVASQEEDMGQFDTVEPLEESTTSLVSSSTSAYSSFPVDVVVYVRVQVLAFILTQYYQNIYNINIKSVTFWYGWVFHDTFF